MRTVVHVTHEAVEKMGGIGAVLDGLITSQAYNESIGRSILVAPLFTTEGPAEGRLGTSGEVLYSSMDGITNHPAGRRLKEVEQAFNLNVVYGRRTFHGHNGVTSQPEVLLVNVDRMALTQVNRFKGQLYDSFGISSDRYEHSWEFDQYVKLAPPAIAALHALGALCWPMSLWACRPRWRRFLMGTRISGRFSMPTKWPRCGRSWRNILATIRCSTMC